MEISRNIHDTEDWWYSWTWEQIVEMFQDEGYYDKPETTFIEDSEELIL